MREPDGYEARVGAFCLAAGPAPDGGIERPVRRPMPAKPGTPCTD
jgi:hypothetical protein